MWKKWCAIIPNPSSCCNVTLLLWAVPGTFTRPCDTVPTVRKNIDRRSKGLVHAETEETATFATCNIISWQHTVVKLILRAKRITYSSYWDFLLLSKNRSNISAALRETIPNTLSGSSGTESLKYMVVWSMTCIINDLLDTRRDTDKVMCHDLKFGLNHSRITLKDRDPDKIIKHF